MSENDIEKRVLQTKWLEVLKDSRDLLAISKEQRMNDHRELLKEARELTIAIELRRGDARQMLSLLADIVEAQDQAESEAVAACRTCEETIDEILRVVDVTQDNWIKLRAAGHVAKRAAKESG